MGSTAVLDREIIEEIEIKKNLIDRQNEKKILISPIINDASYLHELLTKKDSDKLTKIVEKITEIEGIIEDQYKKIGRARKEGVEIRKTVNTALYNELVVCKEIINDLNDAPRLIEKLDELNNKMTITMRELRTL